MRSLSNSHQWKFCAVEDVCVADTSVQHLNPNFRRFGWLYLYLLHLHRLPQPPTHRRCQTSYTIRLSMTQKPQPIDHKFRGFSEGVWDQKIEWWNMKWKFTLACDDFIGPCGGVGGDIALPRRQAGRYRHFPVNLSGKGWERT